LFDKVELSNYLLGGANLVVQGIQDLRNLPLLQSLFRSEKAQLPQLLAPNGVERRTLG